MISEGFKMQYDPASDSEHREASVRNEIARLYFYRGLLFALRASGVCDFPAQGIRLHRAFNSTIDLAQRMTGEGADAQMIAGYLRHFVVSPQPRDMVLEGEEDLLLSLDEPSMHRASFVIDESAAAKGLAGIEAGALFMRLGRHFAAQLGD
jgi:hypothetical protein